MESHMNLSGNFQSSSALPRRLRLSDSPSRPTERRRFARVDMNLSASVSVSEQAWHGQCLNLSIGGALLRLEAERQLPDTFLLHLVLPIVGDLPVPVIARRVEVLGTRVRLAFDPLPAPLATAVTSQLLSRVKAAKRRKVLPN
jgi:PilZ domain